MINEHEETPCPADAKSDERSSRSGGEEYTNVVLLKLAVSIRRLAAEMHRQNDLYAALVEQNATMIEMLIQRDEEDDDDETTYLDGTPRTG